MSEYTGYNGNSLDFLKKNKILVGDSVKILGDITYSGIVMPRYEHSDDKHIVLKLKKLRKTHQLRKILRKIKKLRKTVVYQIFYYYQREVQLQVKLIIEQVLLHQY
jgi:hypothetical protein